MTMPCMILVGYNDDHASYDAGGFTKVPMPRMIRVGLPWCPCFIWCGWVDHGTYATHDAGGFTVVPMPLMMRMGLPLWQCLVWWGWVLFAPYDVGGFTMIPMPRMMRVGLLCYPCMPRMIRVGLQWYPCPVWCGWAFHGAQCPCPVWCGWVICLPLHICSIITWVYDR